MKATISMRAALADKNLLGAVLAGDSWSLWRTMVIAIMGEKLKPDELSAFQAVTGRDTPPPARVEEALFVVGRRGGKDRAISVLAAYLAGLVDWSKILAKGERGVLPIVAPDQRQSKIQRDYVEGVFDASPILSKLVVNRTSDALELSNGISVEVRAANFRRLRGVTAVGVIASEAAFWHSDETSSNADTEILGSLRPTLATTRGPMIIITSPYARRGEVWSLYRRHFGPAGDPLVLVAQGATRQFNPTLAQSVIDRALERDHAAASAEYLAQFRTDLAGFISRELVEGAVDRGVHVRPPMADVAYYAFADPSGGMHDSFTVSIGHAEGDRVVLDCLFERKPPFNPSEVVAEIVELLRGYRITQVTGDKYAAMWVIEAFQKCGMSYLQSERDRSAIYLDALPLFTSGRVSLIDNQRCVSQFAALERRTSSVGKDKVDHGPGGADDLCNSAAGALVGCLAPREYFREFFWTGVPLLGGPGDSGGSDNYRHPYATPNLYEGLF
jgi:hypothetical protein